MEKNIDQLVDKKYVGTIDCTPTWEGILPTILELLESDGPNSQRVAKAELLKMAKLADAYVEVRKTAESIG